MATQEDQTTKRLRCLELVTDVWTEHADKGEVPKDDFQLRDAVFAYYLDSLDKKGPSPLLKSFLENVKHVQNDMSKKAE